VHTLVERTWNAVAVVDGPLPALPVDRVPRPGVNLVGMSDFETVTPTDVPAGAQLIDIREPDEYNQWHAEGAVNLPLSELQSRYGEFDFDRDIYLICLSGGRSAKAAQWLEMNGIDTINVGSGTIGWRDAGLPIVGTEG
jgi:rhodanese-related sulfurtransferase